MMNILKHMGHSQFCLHFRGIKIKYMHKENLIISDSTNVLVNTYLIMLCNQELL